MKDVRWGVRWCLFVTASVYLLWASGCDDRSMSQAELNYQQQYERDYQWQQDILKKQNAEWQRQVEKIEEQEVRYDAILGKWEEHSERVEALLDRWDRILSVLEEHSSDR